ncbi:hypothetical protein LCGC14_0922460 [marine sediment metagenome]|uniref:Uncharacterized protein n=1 Tax=marine sediment metagenome TaxID=412755 RepID=A0A0F9R916_9ZZZZ
MTEVKEGWTWLRNSPKWHCFIDGRSICKKFMLWINPELEQGKDDSPDNCKACMKALAKRKLN